MLARTQMAASAPEPHAFAKLASLVPGARPIGHRSHANSGYMLADAMCTRRPIQYGCCSVNSGCQNGNSGTNMNHSVAEENRTQGIASRNIVQGDSVTVHRPKSP